MVVGLIDADVLVDIMRGESLAVHWGNSQQKRILGVPSIAWMEVVKGASDKIKREQTIRFLKAFKVVHYESGDSFWAMHQFSQYHLSHGVGIGDVMIAAIALRLNVPLYTRNLKHYNPLPGVQVIKPY